VNVIVFGAGDAGSMLIWRLKREPQSAYRRSPFSMTTRPSAGCASRASSPRDRTRMASSRQHGSHGAGHRDRTGHGTAIRDLTAQAESCGLIPKVVPSVSELLTGSARIEGCATEDHDLLGRRPVQTDVAAVAGQFAGKRILVTGRVGPSARNCAGNCTASARLS